MTSIPKVPHIAQILAKKISSTDRKIVDYIQQNNQAFLSEIAEALSISKSTVSRRASNLQKEGLIIKVKENNQMKLVWVGGVPALESELNEATKKHISASILAENYDSLITSSFSLFNLLFEDNYWEIIMNLKEGLSDIEVSQYIGDSIPLDSVRRILITCDTHQLIKINTIREHSGDDFTKLFEPLYRIDQINKEYLNYLKIIRGLASAVYHKMENKKIDGYSHIYESLLELNLINYTLFEDKIISKKEGDERELIIKALSNYDFAPDLDKIYRQQNWRQKLQSANNVILDDSSNSILIDNKFLDECKKGLKNLE